MYGLRNECNKEYKKNTTTCLILILCLFNLILNLVFFNCSLMHRIFLTWEGAILIPEHHDPFCNLPTRFSFRLIFYPSPFFPWEYPYCKNYFFRYNPPFRKNFCLCHQQFFPDILFSSQLHIWFNILQNNSGIE